MSETPAPLGDLTPALLRRAVDLYLGLAYPDGPPPAPVQDRLRWPEATVEVIVAGRPFETTLGPTPQGKAPIHALRLGNHRYPHMKLQLQAWPNACGYLLSVNTHDQIEGLDPNAPGTSEFLAMQLANQSLKEAIEQAWDQEGLPTFHRYLRDYLGESRAGASPS